MVLVVIVFAGRIFITRLFRDGIAAVVGFVIVPIAGLVRALLVPAALLVTIIILMFVGIGVRGRASPMIIILVIAIALFIGVGISGLGRAEDEKAGGQGGDGQNRKRFQ